MYRLTPKEEISARIQALQERLGRDGVDAAFLVHNADLFYFTGSIQQGVLIVPAGGEPVYFVRRVYERAQAEAALEHIVRIASPKEIPAYFERKKVSFGVIGFELDVMPVATFQRFSRLFPEAKPVDVSGPVREGRAVKGASEIDAMRACGRKLSGLLASARGDIRPGITETQLGGVLQGRGISGAAAAIPSYADFPTAGKGSGPYVPVGQGPRPFRENEPILVDLMWAQDGYLVDMARTYVIGELPDKLLMAYEMTVKVMRNIESATRPGALAGDLYEIGLEMASRSPFAAN